MKNNYYKVDSILFTTHSGVTTEIANFFNSLTIYESMYEATVTAQLTMLSKGTNAASIVGAIGGEHIKIKMKYPADVGIDELEMDFLLLSPGQGITQAEHSFIVFDLVTPEYIANRMATVKKSYTDLASEQANNIYNDYIVENMMKLPYDIEPKEFFVYGTKDIFKSVFTNNKAFDALHYLSNKARSSEDNVDYMFWQTMHKFYFVSIYEVLKQNEVFGSYSEMPLMIGDSSSLGDRDLVQYYNSIFSYKIDQQFSFMNSVNGGTLSSKIHRVNYYTQSFEKEDLSYKDAATPPMDDSSAYSDSFQFDIYKDTRTFVQLSKHGNEDALGDSDKFEKSYEFSHKRNIQMRNHLEGTIVTMKLAGSKYMSPGRIINATFLNEPSTNKENNLNGKYLVVKTKHVYNDVEGGFYTYVTCAKDSYTTS